jgi:hypothetical protein
MRAKLNALNSASIIGAAHSKPSMSMPVPEFATPEPPVMRQKRPRRRQLAHVCASSTDPGQLSDKAAMPQDESDVITSCDFQSTGSCSNMGLSRRNNQWCEIRNHNNSNSNSTSTSSSTLVCCGTSYTECCEANPVGISVAATIFVLAVVALGMAIARRRPECRPKLGRCCCQSSGI